MLYRIALMLLMAVLLTPACRALADAPESPEMSFEEVELLQNGELPSLLLDDGSIALDIDLEDVLASDGLLEVEILNPDAAAQAQDEAVALEIDDVTIGEIEPLPGTQTDPLPEDMQNTELALNPDADGMGEGAETSGEETVQNITLPGGADNDALFGIYLKQALPGMVSRHTNASAQTGRKSLSGLSLKLYDALVPMIREVAQGKRVSTLMSVEDDKIDLSDSWWTAEQLGVESLDDSGVGNAILAAEGFDQKKILQALLADCPYDLYWFNKATGGGMGWNYIKYTDTINGVRCARLGNLTAKLSVAADYSRTGEIGTYEVNDLPARVSTAAANINGVVADNRDRDDLAKLRAYANRICGLVDYNDDAVNDPNTPYGDPWQLVFIFDGDPNTKVVCEGYSKGFKYLCDLSDFDGDVACELMSGTIPVNNKMGNHMWNTVHMPDGRNYLADLTNSDGGDSCNEKRFLKGCDGEGGGPYTCDGLKYTYNANMLSTFGNTWLTLSNADYGKGYAVGTAVEHGVMTASPAPADAGDVVTLTVTPDAGYVSAAPTVCSGNQTLNVQQTGVDTWQFTMPFGDVSATATCIGCNVEGFSGVYDGNPHGIAVTSMDVSATVNYGTERGTYDLDTSPVWKDAGDYTVYYRIESGRYKATEGESYVRIAPKTVTLIWSDTGFTYDGNSHVPTATATGILPGDSCAVTVGGEQTGVGDYTAVATGLSNGNYALPEAVTQGFSIGKRTVGLSWSGSQFVYDGKRHAPVPSATGLVSGDACTVTVSGEQTDAGVYTAQATGLSNDNYALPAENTQAFEIVPKTVGLKWTGTSLTYNGKSQGPKATATGLIAGDKCSVTVTGTKKSTGSYTATATALSNRNYVLPENRTKAFTIAPKTVGLKWTGTSLTYNGKSQGPKATATGLISGDTCTVKVTGKKKSAGSYTATAVALSNRNYTLPENRTRAFTIAKKTVKLKWTRTSLTYNGKPQKPVATATGLIKGDKCSVTVTGAKKNAGSYTARASKLSNGNYKLPKTRTKTFVIKKKTIRLKWTRTKLKYNGEAQKPVATATGLIKGDKCMVTVSGAKKKKGTYIAKATKLSNGNYQLPKAVTVEFTIY